MTTYNITGEPGVHGRPAEPSIGELFGDLTRESSELIRREINLAKVELSDKAAKAGKDLGMVVAGAIVALGGLLTLVAFLVLGLAALGVHLWLSALIIGAMLTGVGGALSLSGLEKLKKVDPVPHQTMEALRGSDRS